VKHERSPQLHFRLCCLICRGQTKQARRPILQRQRTGAARSGTCQEWRGQNGFRRVDALGTCTVQTATHQIAGPHSQTHYATGETVTIGTQSVNPKQT
jgi:hypothetical protein